MAKRTDKDQIWCEKNITPDEASRFWENWCKTQWGMPTFLVMRLCIETQRTHAVYA